MNALDLTRAFAASAGYSGNDPHMLAAMEDIRQHGIREARKAHNERYELVKRYSECSGLLFVRIRPSLCLQEAIEDANQYRVMFSNMPRWRQENRTKELAKHMENRVLARYFRRFGKRIWLRSAA